MVHRVLDIVVEHDREDVLVLERVQLDVVLFAVEHRHHSTNVAASRSELHVHSILERLELTSIVEVLVSTERYDLALSREAGLIVERELVVGAHERCC